MNVAIIVDKIARALNGLAGRRVAVLGLAFKPNTDDVRESPSLYVCRELARAGASGRAFDPVASAQAAAALSDVASAVSFPSNAYNAVQESDALVIMTEWNEFRGLDLQRVRRLMSSPIVIDARNVLDPGQTRALGFTYFCTGRERAGALKAVGV